MLRNYKWYIALALFVMYSGAIWHVSSKWTDAEYNKERLEQAKTIIRIQDANAELATKLAKDVKDSLDQYKKDHYALNPTAPVYTDCLVDDSVRSQYKRKLEAQRRLVN